MSSFCALSDSLFVVFVNKPSWIKHFSLINFQVEKTTLWTIIPMCIALLCASVHSKPLSNKPYMFQVKEAYALDSDTSDFNASISCLNTSRSTSRGYSGTYWHISSFRPPIKPEPVLIGSKLKTRKSSMFDKLQTLDQGESQTRKYFAKKRRRNRYRAHLWTPLQIKNCYKTPPASVLSAYELDRYEDSLFHSIIFSGRDKFHLNQKSDSQENSPQFNRRIRNPGDYKQLYRRWPSRVQKRSLVSEPTNGLKKQYFKDAAIQFSPARTSDPVITVYRLLIRPAFLELKDGSISARLRYIVQLHKKITGYYRLTMEARLNPAFPPIFVAEMKDVCTHWPANVPQSQCSLKRSRFYQKGQICLCHMPPGLYHQRLRFNMKSILDDLDVPRYLVNVLFQGQKLHIHLDLKLENENSQPVGCIHIKLPLLLTSA